MALAHAACPIALLTGDLAAAEHYVTMLLEHSTRHALTLWRAGGRSFQGVLVIQRGDVITGLRLLRAGFDEFGEAGSTLLQFLAFLMAEALSRAGQNAEGLAAIDEAIARSERTEEHWAMAELLRVKGELLLLQGAPGAAAAAEDHFRQALDWARRQGALSWELRAATSLEAALVGLGVVAGDGQDWSAPRSSLAENLASASGRCTLSSRPFGKTAVDCKVLRAVPVREYGAEQPVHFAVDPVREVEGIGIAVTAADPELEGPKSARV